MTDRFVSLLRHGEVTGGGRFRGAGDDTLSDVGWGQMERQALALLGSDPAFDRILYSPARRCAAFAERLASWEGLSAVGAEGLAERGFGDWEGRTAREIPEPQLRRFWQDPVGYCPPGAEPFPDFQARVLGAWAGVCGPDGAHTLVVTHGGVIRIILAAVLGLGDGCGILVEVPNACLTRLRLPEPPGRPSLMSHGGPDFGGVP